MKQFIPRTMELPELGEVRELVDRQGNLKALGVVYGHLPKEQSVLIREIEVNEKGEVCINKSR